MNAIAKTTPAPEAKTPPITGLALLRAPFPAHQISTIPKGGVKLSYVGHAALTDRLLDADPVNGYGLLFSICAFAYVLAFALHHILVPKLEMASLGTDESGASYSIASMVLSTLGLMALFLSFSEGSIGKMAVGGLLLAWMHAPAWAIFALVGAGMAVYGLSSVVIVKYTSWE